MPYFQPTILIVDDEPQNLRSLDLLLKQEGYQVRKAICGEMALATVVAEPPDLILLDIYLPDITGYDVCTRLKADPYIRDIPVIFLSALNHASDKVQAFNVGGADYITKPFEANEMLIRIRHQLTIRLQKQQLQQEIAERQQMMAILQRRNQELNALVRAFPDRLFRVQTDDNLWSPLAERYEAWAATLSEPEPIAYPMTKLWPGLDPAKLGLAMERVLQGHGVELLEFSQAEKDETNYYEVRLVPLSEHEVMALVRDITRRRRTEQVRFQQVQHEQLLGGITQRIHQSLELSTILKTAVEEVQKLLRVDRVLVYRMGLDGSGYVTHEAVSDPALSILQQTLYDPCFAHGHARLYAAGRVRAIANINAEPQLASCHQTFLAHLRVQANLVLPIIQRDSQQGETLWGLLIAHHCTAPRPWPDWEVQALQQLASQLAIAIQQSQLFDRTRQQAQREVLLNDILATIRNSLDIHQILQHTVEQVLTAFAASRSSVTFWQPEATDLEPVITAVAADIPKTQPRWDLLHQTPLMELILKGTAPVCVENIHTSLLNQTLPLEILRSDVQAFMAVAIGTEEQIRGILWVQQCDRPRAWNDSDRLLLQEVADQLAIALHQAELYQQLQSANQELKRLANLDGLTQLANRRRFDEYFLQEWRRHQREGTALSLILCDVDDFKKYNDTYGHLSGDDCLCQIALALNSAVKRPADLVARYGGEEFAITLPHTDTSGAIHLAQQIQRAIAQLQIPHQDSTVGDQVTISLGIATLIPTPQLAASDLIHAADQALYAAKAQGRNCYSVWSPTCSDFTHDPSTP